MTTITPSTTTDTNALGTTTYGYDSLSRVVSVKDGNHAGSGYEISDIDYDGEDRVTKITFGDSSWVSYGYDANGNQTSRSDSASHSSSYSYDRSNRRSSETISGATTSYGYDASGNLASITDASGTVGYGYDNANRVHTITQPDSTQIAVDYSSPSTRPRYTKTTFPGGIT